MQIIVYTNTNGSVTTCIPVNDINYVIENDIPKNCNYILMEFDQLPHQDEDFFDAWEINENSIIVNLNKAKEITKNKLREQRYSLLIEQDILYQKALESGSDTTAIVAEKNRLRDITTLADSATTLEELRQLKVESSTLKNNNILIDIPTTE